MLRWLRFGLGALALLYLALLLGLFGLRAVGAARSGWPALLLEALPYLFLPAPFLCVSAVALRSRTALVLAAVPLATFAYLYGPRLAPRRAVEAAGPDFRVLSFNVGAARGLGQPEPIARTVRAANADLVCLVEAREDTPGTVGAALGDSHPYRADGGSVFVFSRLPLLNPRRGPLRSGAHDSLLVDVVLGDRLLTLAVVHLQRTDEYPGLGRGFPALLRAASGYRTDRRDAAAADLAALLHDVGAPLVLVGDFNLTEWSHSYQRLTADLEDSHLEAGQGFGHTYPTTLRSVVPGLALPLLRIDYVFHSTDLVALRAWVGPDGSSDHLPVLADLAFRY